MFPSKRIRSIAAKLAVICCCTSALRADDDQWFHISDENMNDASWWSDDGTSYASLTPSMLGDGFFSRTGPLRGPLEIDRLFVSVNDLDAPNPLPPGNTMLSITEPGPLGVFVSSVTSVQDIQQLLRSARPLPAATLVGTINDSGTLTTASTIAQIQSQLASTPEAFDIIALQAPPASYDAGANTAFQTRNGAGGTTTFDTAASGALLQGGADTLAGGEDLDAFYYYSYLVNISIDSPHAAAVRSGVLKASDGNSPLPHARVFVHYGLFDNVGLLTQGQTVNRFVPGFERLFLDGLFSLEMRFPFTSATDSNLIASQTGVTNTSDVEFGNISAFLKFLLHETEDTALSAGLALTLPTANALNINATTGAPLLAVKNDSVHIGPFLAGLYAPNDRVFAQGFLQYDFAANGNEVLANSSGNGLTSAGYLNDAAFLYLDAGVGYWLNSPEYSDHPTAFMAELHYNASISGSDIVRSGNFQIGDAASDINILNLTLGASIALNHNTNISAGYVTPLTSGSDQQYDGALNVSMEYRPQ